MSTPRVHITGYGMITGIGNNANENYQNLIQEKSGIQHINRLDTVYKGIMPAAEVKLSNETLAELLQIPSLKYTSRNTLLALFASKEAISHAQWNNADSCRSGFISASTVGGMDKSELFYSAYLNQDRKASIADILSHDCGDSTERVAEILGPLDFITTISTACSSAANAIMLGARLIRSGKLDRVMVGGVDALTKFTLNGFNTLMILDSNLCTPFDENRKGLNLGEGAAYLVLESEQRVSDSGKKSYALVGGFANANDAYHQTASSPDGNGAFLAISEALSVAGLTPTDIDYVNVHGTGTPNNDLSESIALKRIFGDNVPDFSSTKAYTGHTLAACGAIEAIYSIFSIQNSCVFPNLRFETPIEDTKLIPVTKLKNKTINHVLSNSFGFGGNNSSLVISKV